MNTEAIVYQLPSGRYAIEGCEFVIRGPDGKLTIVPEGLAGPPIKGAINNWISLRVVFLGSGEDCKRLEGEMILYDYPVSILSQFTTDIDDIVSGSKTSIVFPSEIIARSIASSFQCIILPDGLSSTHWSMHFRFVEPQNWDGSTLPTLREHSNRRFVSLLSVICDLEYESLLSIQTDITKFLSWIERESIPPVQK